MFNLFFSKYSPDIFAFQHLPTKIFPDTNCSDSITGWLTHILYRCHELSLHRIELAITSVSSLLANQLVASESQRARDHGQSAVVTPRVNLSLSFLSRFARPVIDSYRQLAVRIVVSTVSAFRRANNLLSSRIQIVHRANFKLDSLANLTRFTGFESVS